MEQLIKNIGLYLLRRNEFLVTAESCTGGWIAKSLTDVSGSSQWFDRGFITYSNASKVEMLNVNASVIEKHGAVSEQVAVEMAAGALKNSHSTYSLSVTGIAGPSGGSVEKPVGMVCFGWGKKGEPIQAETRVFEGNRDEIRYKTVEYVLRGFCDRSIN